MIENSKVLFITINKIIRNFICRQDGLTYTSTCRIHGSKTINESTLLPMETSMENTRLHIDTSKYHDHKAFHHCTPDVHRTCWCVNFIAEHTRIKDGCTKVSIFSS